MLVAGAHKGGADRTVNATSQATSPPAWLNDGSSEAQPHPISRHGYPRRTSARCRGSDASRLVTLEVARVVEADPLGGREQWV